MEGNDDNRKRHAYLIMAHDNFEQLKILIRTLDHERTDIFIHIDRKSSFTDFESLKKEAKKSYVDVISTREIYWADISQSLCEWDLIERAHNKERYRYYHLISNADFPIKSQTEILKFFDENDGKEFITFRFPMNLWPFKNKPYTTEIKYYHVLTKHLRSRHKVRDKIVYCIEYFCVFIQFLLRIDRIKGAFIPAKGSQWFSVTDDFVELILKKRAWLEKQFKMARSGDEVWPAVLAYNSEFRDHLYDKTYTCSNNGIQRYIDWNRGFPYTFKVEDYDEIINSGLLFVRKTDMRKDGGLVEKLYKHVMEGESEN